MNIHNPLGYVRECIAKAVADELGLPPNVVVKGFEIPREEFGDLTFLLSRIGVGAEHSEKLAEITKRCNYVAEAKSVGIYVNMFLDRGRVTDILFRSLVFNRDSYGLYRESKTKRIVVEFVSANPLHPLHIGAARNAALGQFISNILKTCGNQVQTRFYINDVGKQVALLALGAKQLQDLTPPQNMKPDHWVGLIYAITNVISMMQTLRKRIEFVGNAEEKKEVQKELDELLADALRLRNQVPELFDTIAEKLKNIDIEAEVSKIMKLYESGDPETTNLIRRLVTLCIEGFKQTLTRFGVEIDVWDWESELVWGGEVDNIIQMLEKSPLTKLHKGALAIDVGKLAENPELRERLSIGKDFEVPPMIIKRSDGTTLYIVRDIAYTLKKFREFQADKVINVIASEQKLPQTQLRLALYLLGYKKEAENTMHYSYEMVMMEGMKMSSRRGRMITLDEVLDTAKAKVLMELENRGVTSEAIAEKIGVAAVKFYLLMSSPSRPAKFSWELALNFEKNSAPYLLYTYARTEGIFRKARELGENLDVEIMLSKADRRLADGNQKRWRLVKLIASFPDTIYGTYTNLDPSILITYILKLADEFNSWYDEEPILLEENEGVRASKLLLTYGVNVVLKNALKILGIEPLERL